MKQLYRVIILAFFLFSQTEACSKDCLADPFYFYAEFGGSFSRCAAINVDTSVWDPVEMPSGGGLGARRARSIKIDALEELPYEDSESLKKSCNPCFNPKTSCGPATPGYSAPLGRAPMFGFGFGYYFNEHLSGGFSVNHRSNFRYQQFQQSVAVDTPGFIGAKTRFFDFDNTSFMVNLRADYEYTPECTRGPKVTLKPYIGLGIGMSKNSVYNFHSVTTSSVALGDFSSFTVRSILNDNTVNRFAWQGEFGLQASLCQYAFIGLGYRYFNGNKFFSNNYFIDIPVGFSTPLTCPPWCGTFATQELVASFSINF